MAEVMAQQGTMAHGHRVDLRQGVHAFQRLQNAAGIGAHQAVVIEAKVGSDRAGITVEQFIRAVMKSEGITGVKRAGAVIEGKNRVRPVQVGRTEEFKAVLNAAVWIGAQVQLFTALHRSGSERTVHLVLQKLNRYFRSNNFNLRIEVNEVTNQAGMIRLGMAHDQHIDCRGIDLILQ